MAEKLTITEALAETKTIKSRIEKKITAVQSYIARDSQVLDPMIESGGSTAFIASERQSIRDLEERLIRIRVAIQAKNLSTTVAVGGTTRTIAEWLTWRKEVEATAGRFLQQMFERVNATRRQAQAAGRTIVAADQNPSTKNVYVNVSEKELSEQLENHVKIVGDLDGKLSLINATTTIDL